MSQQSFEYPQTPSVEPKTPIDRFFAAASIGLTQWWRWVVGAIAIVFGLFAGAQATVQACKSSTLEAICDREVDSFLIILEPVLEEFESIGMLIAIWIAVKLLHKKSLTQVTTGRASFDYSRTLYGALAGLCMLIVADLVYEFILGRFIGVSVGFNAANLYPPVFLVLLFIVVPIQAGSEEVFYRGYIMQGLSLLTRNRLVLVVATAIIFTTPHLLNKPDYEALELTLYYLHIMVPGIAFAVLMLLDGGIEVTVGVHTMNNFYNKLFAIADYGGQFSTVLIYTADVFVWALIIVILNLKYKWFAYPWSKSGRE